MLGVMSTMKRNIAAFAAGPFKPHGRIEMWSEGPVVRIDAQGPFNPEAVQAVGLAMRDLFAEMPPSERFADILTFHDSILTSPDGLQAFEQFLQAMSAAAQAPKAVAYVVGPDVEGRALMLPLFAEIYARHGREFRAFECIEQAEAWARERLAED